MITCPYCGTNYQTFQPNCGNCGGILPGEPERSVPVFQPQPLVVPPSPPRVPPPGFMRQRYLTSAWAIVGGVFAILGTVFTIVGLILTITVVGAFVGLPFLAFGLLFLLGGVPMLIVRYQDVQRQVELFKQGETAIGRIKRVRQNLSVRVNGRHPWIITYSFQVTGVEYTAEFSTLDPSTGTLRLNQQLYVLYWPDNPQRSIPYLENDP